MPDDKPTDVHASVADTLADAPQGEVTSRREVLGREHFEARAGDEQVRRAQLQESERARLQAEREAAAEHAASQPLPPRRAVLPPGAAAAAPAPAPGAPRRAVLPPGAAEPKK